LDDFSRGSSACSTYNYKYINRHCATPLNCGLQTDNYICISGYCCVKSNGKCAHLISDVPHPWKSGNLRLSLIKFTKIKYYF